MFTSVKYDVSEESAGKATAVKKIGSADLHLFSWLESTIRHSLLHS